MTENREIFCINLDQDGLNEFEFDDLFEENVIDIGSDPKSSMLVVDFGHQIGVVRVGRELDPIQLDPINSCKPDRVSSLENVFASYTQITYQTLKPMIRADDVECLTNTLDKALKNLWVDDDVS